MPILSPVTDKAQVYAGRWANVTMRPFVYNNVSSMAYRWG